MTRSWYPWQLFIRKWEVIFPVVVTLIVITVLIIWLEVGLSRVPQPVFLHYSTDLGVDALGSPHVALLLPGALFGFLLINVVWSNLVMLTNRTAALIALWSMLPLSFVAMWFGILILRVNGA